jgi:endonuclease III-like uncharacterized protein
VELSTLENCTTLLETALVGPERELVHFLKQENFISDDVRNKILNPVSVLGEEDKAGELVKWIRLRVKQDRTSYRKFVEGLKRFGGRYHPIVCTLEGEFMRLASTYGVTFTS